jgi:secreted protein with Ig-like and vWFA domain
MAVEIKLGADVVWGSSTAGTLSHGKILSADKKSGSKLFEQEDEDGETYAPIFYDQTTEISVEILANAAAALPDPGDALTVVGVTDALVIDATMKWASGQTKKIAMTLKKWTA